MSKEQTNGAASSPLKPIVRRDAGKLYVEELQKELLEQTKKADALEDKCKRMEEAIHEIGGLAENGELEYYAVCHFVNKGLGAECLSDA